MIFQQAGFIIYFKSSYVIAELLQSFQPMSLLGSMETCGPVARKASFSKKAEFEALQYIYAGSPHGAHLPGHTFFPLLYLSVRLILFLTHHWMSEMPTQLCEKCLMFKSGNLVLLLT